MGGIFGVVGANVSVDALCSAAATVAFRGTPRAVAAGSAVVGWYDGTQWPVGCDLGPDGSVVVADARIDAHRIPGPVRERNVALVHRAVRERGVDGFDLLCGDFSAAWVPASGEWSLVVSRDPAASRPLFWARDRGVVAFATDVDVLAALGVASGALDADVIRGALRLQWDLHRTAFEGVRRVHGGVALCVGRDGEVVEHRFFHPERVAVRWDVTLAEAAHETRAAVTAAVAARSGGKRTAVLLSGGRDSGSVATAWAGLSPSRSAGTDALTHSFDDDLPCAAEESRARDLARRLGLRIAPVRLGSEVDADLLARIPDLQGTPMPLPMLPQVVAMHDAVVEHDIEVLLDGDGGDYWFHATPIAVADIIRSGRLRLATAAASAYHQDWNRSRRVVANTIARAMLPPAAVALYSRLRKREGVDHRSDRSQLLALAADLGGSMLPELWDRCMAPAGARQMSPLMDRRVVEVGLSLPTELRLPVPEPKPVLARALLGATAGSRRKARFTEYYVRIVERTPAELRALATTRLAEHDLLPAEGVHPVHGELLRLAAAAWIDREDHLRG